MVKLKSSLLLVLLNCFGLVACANEKSALDLVKRGDTAFNRADYEQARRLYEQAQTELQDAKNPWMSEITNDLAGVALQQGRTQDFYALFTQAKTAKQALGGIMTTAGDENLLHNGGFEHGLLFPWGTGHYERTDGKFSFGLWWNSNNAAALMKIDRAEKYRGCCSLRITNLSPAAPHVFTTLSQRIPDLEPNAVYRISGYAKAQDLTGGAVTVAVDAAWDKRTPALPPGSYDWRPFSADINIGHNDTIDFRILHVNTGTVWLDELNVKKLAWENEADPFQQLESRYDAGQYNEALKLAQELEQSHKNQKGALARIRWISGRIYLMQGNYARALESLRWALDKGIARAAFELGQAYYSLGDYAGSEKYLKQAYQTVRGDQGSESLVLNQLSRCYLAQNRIAEAIDAQRQSYHILKHIEDRHGQSLALLQLGRIYLAVRNTQAALPELKLALQLSRELDDPLLRSDVLLYLADASSGQDAQSFVSESLREKQSLGDSLGLAGALSLQSRLLRKTNPAAAVLFGKQAVNQLQSLRMNMLQMDKALQQAFLQDKSRVYQDLADLLIELGRLPEAQQVLNMLKKEEYFDFVQRDEAARQSAQTQASFNTAEQPWVARYTEIQGNLAALGQEFSELKQKARQGELSAAEQKRRDALRADLQVASLAFDAYLEELRKAFTKADAERAIEFGEKNLDKLRPLQSTLRQLGHGAVLVHYLITPDKLRMILTTPDIQLAREVSVSSIDLHRAILEFRRKLKTPKQSAEKESQKLYEWLIKPIEADLKQAGAKILMLSLDGALRYVPIAALNDGKHYVIENYALALYTEAARGNLERVPEKQWRIAGLGVSDAMPGFNPLPAVKQELEQIVKRNDKDPDGVDKGIIRLNRDFTRNAFLDALDEGYPVLHIASHFAFTPGTDQDSYLLLGDGGKVTLADIRSGYDFNSLDLLTLSACNTALGDNASGREIEGFGALAQNRGAKGVLATLWSVNDASTGLFMQQFYRNQAKYSKAEALQKAQLAMLSEGEYRHPYYWAPFVLLGNWL